MNKTIVILVLSLLCVRCGNYQMKCINYAKEYIDSDCLFVKEELNIDSCLIEISDEIIPIETAPFFEKIDSIAYFYRLTIDDPLAFLTFWDIEHQDSLKQNIRLDKTENVNTNLKLYCSNVFENIMTCNLVLSNKTEEKNSFNINSMFKRNVIYLFEFNKQGQIITSEKQILIQ